MNPVTAVVVYGTLPVLVVALSGQFWSWNSPHFLVVSSTTPARLQQSVDAWMKHAVAKDEMPAKTNPRPRFVSVAGYYSSQGLLSTVSQNTKGVTEHHACAETTRPSGSAPLPQE